MTFRGLLEALQGCIETCLTSMELNVRQDEDWDSQPLYRKIEVYKQKMPRPSDVEEKIPYILLQILNGADDMSNGKSESTVNVRILIAVYDEDPEQGTLATENIVERLRVGLQRTGMIGKRFELVKPFEYLFYPDDTVQYDVYHLAEIMTKWKIPPVERVLPGVDW